MKLRNGLIAIAVVLTASFLVLDWMAFYTPALILLALSGYRQDS